MASIYPKIHYPILRPPRSEVSYVPTQVGPAFDFLTGEFVIGRDGKPVMAEPKTVYEDWVLKACCTERGTRIAYSDNFGVEFRDIPQTASPRAIRSMMIRSLTETIMAHPQTEFVRRFRFSGEGDEVHVDFLVKGKFYDESSFRLSF